MEHAAVDALLCSPALPAVDAHREACGLRPGLRQPGEPGRELGPGLRTSGRSRSRRCRKRMVYLRFQNLPGRGAGPGRGLLRSQTLERLMARFTEGGVVAH